LGLIESESNADLASNDPGFTQSQISTVEISTALAEERDREIQQIVNTIVELAQASVNPTHVTGNAFAPTPTVVIGFIPCRLRIPLFFYLPCACLKSACWLTSL